MPERLSSLDNGYQPGNLSLFPEVIDDKESLYEVKNNAETTLKTGLGYNSKIIIADNTELFPSQGIIRVGAAPGESGVAELIYYYKKTSSTFQQLVRGLEMFERVTDRHILGNFRRFPHQRFHVKIGIGRYP